MIRLRALIDALGERDPQYRKEVAFTAAQWRRRLRRPRTVRCADRRSARRTDRRTAGEPETVYLYSLWLDPAVRGQGLARPLVAAAVDWARDTGKAITLRVASGNAAARAVYESLGFAAVTAEKASSRETKCR